MTFLPRRAIRAFLILAFCALGLGSFAAAETVQLPFSMKKGDVFEIEVSTETISRKGGRVNRIAKEERGDVSVVSAGPDGYEVDLVLRETTTGDAAAGSEQFERSVVETFKDRPVRLTLNERGAPIAVQDWDALVREVETIGRRSLPDTMTSQGLQTFDAVIDQLESMNESEAAAVIGKNLVLWSFWHGEEIESEGVETLDSFGHLGVSGEAVAMQTEVTLESLDARTLTLRSITTTDAEDLRAATIATLKNAIRDRAQRRKAIEHFSTARIEQTFEQTYVIDRATGWARRIDQIKRSMIEGLSETVETTRISVTKR